MFNAHFNIITTSKEACSIKDLKKVIVNFFTIVTISCSCDFIYCNVTFYLIIVTLFLINMTHNVTFIL